MLIHQKITSGVNPLESKTIVKGIKKNQCIKLKKEIISIL